MFGHLSNFGRQRTMGQAFGFYLFSVFAGTIGIWALCQIAELMGAKGTDERQLFNALAVGLTALLSLLVLRAKGHLHDVSYLLVTMLGMAGAFSSGGLIVSLMFVAFLTTQPAAVPLAIEIRQSKAGVAY